MAMAVGGGNEGSSSFGHQHDAVDRRHAGAPHYLHHHDSHSDARGQDRQSLAAAAESPPPPPPEVIDLSIDFDGTLLVEQDAGGPRHDAGVHNHGGRKDPQPEVHITVDKFAKYEIVAQTLADLQHRGLKKIGFVNNDYF